MIILQIILTIIAWHRGWKWYSLLPVGLAFGIGFIAGASLGVNGSIEELSWIRLDIAAIIALIFMAIIKKDGIKKE